MRNTKTYILLLILSLMYSNQSNNTEYFGGWPHNPDKNQINGNKLDFDCPNSIGCDCEVNDDCINGNCLRIPRGLYCFPKEGDIFPEFIAIDQYEELVNIYDFANNGKFILIELASTWCAPCNVLANWIAYNDQEITSKRWWKPEYQEIYNMIHNQEIFFITILYENEHRDNADYETLYEWFNNYPDENILLLADTDKKMHQWIKPSGIPAITLLNDKMEIVKFASRGLNEAFDEILKYKDIIKKHSNNNE